MTQPNMKKYLFGFLLLLAAHTAYPQPHRFTLSGSQFLLDGKPFQIISGEMHPARIPREYWQHRIRMAKAMGCNTIAIYLMWNAFEREPGVFDFESERRNFVRFIQLCQQE